MLKLQLPRHWRSGKAGKAGNPGGRRTTAEPQRLRSPPEHAEDPQKHRCVGGRHELLRTDVNLPLSARIDQAHACEAEEWEPAFTERTDR